MSSDLDELLQESWLYREGVGKAEAKGQQQGLPQGLKQGTEEGKRDGLAGALLIVTE
ncbi:MAG TPA: hypothetical protein VKQ36_07040 [Ktedonobacterales bacterium]|nr:hypothetical protein [Ktedonobacterales bacterium]